VTAHFELKLHQLKALPNPQSQQQYTQPSSPKMEAEAEPGLQSPHFLCNMPLWFAKCSSQPRHVSSSSSLQLPGGPDAAPDARTPAGWGMLLLLLLGEVLLRLLRTVLLPLLL
jgi:hypothetical protein